MISKINDIDKKLINHIQSQFPVQSHPYRVLAEQFGMTEEEVWKRINHLRSKGLIRRIGAVFDSTGLGFYSTLVAVKADPAFLEEVAEKINRLPGVTHHYQRENTFNLWFTLTGKDRKMIDETIRDVGGWDGVLDIMDLPATRTFKIKVGFQI